MNPFEKRATEYIRDDLAFLPYVTPEPLLQYLEPHAREDVLFDRLAVLIGSPGSGKTTLARLFLLPTLTTLLNSETLSNHAVLTDALTSCRAIKDGMPLIAGCRIPLESDYRDCWELPYEEAVRHNLLFSLMQARSVLGWLNGFEMSGLSLSDVTLVPRVDSTASLEAIGGVDLHKVRDVARTVERDVYSVTASLVAPPVENLPPGASVPYRPFDVIEAFEIPFRSNRLRVKPLVICDDAHVLHPQQFNETVKWLARREIRVARWVLTRIDALRPQDVLRPDDRPIEDGPGFNRSREMVPIWMQSTQDRASNRRAFRKIATDMAERYLKQMQVFSRRQLTNLPELLDGIPPPIAPSKLKQLQESLSVGRRKQIGPGRRKEIESLIEEYVGTAPELADIRAMMARVLLERYLRRVPQDSLFDEPIEQEPSVPLKVASVLRGAAQIQLYHEYGRPFFYGFDTLCDAASENAERFLRLAGYLVSHLETQIIRGGSNVKLTPAIQDKLLKERAMRMIEEEDLPERARVIRLCEVIASECLESALEPNAQLGEGPNAWGILQSDFDTIASTQPGLARILQSGVAYNMFTLVRDHGTQNEIWCLVELSGAWSLSKGLTLKRGGFLKRKVSHLLAAINPAATS